MISEITKDKEGLTCLTVTDLKESEQTTTLPNALSINTLNPNYITRVATTVIDGRLVTYGVLKTKKQVSTTDPD
jgi:hypothetical protein